ncbi:MAG: type II toxin-antitoxin system RelE/ParE family toxin [Elstera sp.]
MAAKRPLRLGFAPAALDDLENLYDDLAGRHGAQLALAVVVRLERLCALLCQAPNLGRNREELALGLRSFPAEHSLIFYRTSHEQLIVVRVIDARRDVLRALFEEG